MRGFLFLSVRGEAPTETVLPSFCVLCASLISLIKLQEARLLPDIWEFGVFLLHNLTWSQNFHHKAPLLCLLLKPE